MLLVRLAPNLAHWSFLQDWQQVCPQAVTWAAPGLRQSASIIERRRRTRFGSPARYLMSCMPRATLRSSPAAARLPETDRTEWSNRPPLPQSGYQTCWASAPGSRPSSWSVLPYYWAACSSTSSFARPGPAEWLQVARTAAALGGVGRPIAPARCQYRRHLCIRQTGKRTNDSRLNGRRCARCGHAAPC